MTRYRIKTGANDSPTTLVNAQGNGETGDGGGESPHEKAHNEAVQKVRNSLIRACYLASFTISLGVMCTHALVYLLSTLRERSHVVPFCGCFYC